MSLFGLDEIYNELLLEAKSPEEIKKIFEKEFSEEDKRYLNSLGEKRLSKRPDVLLFPEENKAIIIEFKAPDVNVSEYLTQIKGMKYSELPDYDDIWFEGTATYLGKHYHKYTD